MKIVCDNCATKYSIADEKVRGKVFKIRCKKCSHIIVVKGTDSPGRLEISALRRRMRQLATRCTRRRASARGRTAGTSW